MRRATAVLAGAGGVLLIAGMAWLALAPAHVDRLRAGWDASIRFIGMMGFPDSATGAFPAKDVPGIYDRILRVEEDRGREVVLYNAYVVRDPLTQAVTYEYVTRDRVHPRSGRHLAPTDSQLIAVFPHRPSPGTYRWRSNYVKDMPMTFARADTIEGLPVLLFQYQGRAEYTESYAGTAQYPGMLVPPGKEIRCADDAFYIRAWIEEVSGEMVKLEEGCPTGDYVHDVATGRRETPVMRWSGASVGDALIAGVARAKRERARYLWWTRRWPTTLMAAGLMLLLGAAVVWRALPGLRGD